MPAPLDYVYKNFAKCVIDAESKLICDAKWVETNSLEMTKEPERNYAYSVYGTQGDLQCGGDFKKYVNAVFTPAFAPIKRPSMDGGLLSVAPVEPMPARLLERFQGSAGGKKLETEMYKEIVVKRGGNN
jgi:hypothetical protein